MAFVGFVPPGMINMTSVKKSLDYNRKEAVRFAFGAVTVISIQAFIAVTFTQYLVDNPSIVENLSVAAIFVFFALSILFFHQSRRKVTMKDSRNKRSSYLSGAAMASMNMLAIPFFLGYATLLESNGWIIIEPPHNFIYVLFAEIIEIRLQIVARNINIILGTLFLVLAIIASYNVVFS